MPTEPNITINGSEAMRVMENTIPRNVAENDPLEKFHLMLGVLKLLMGDAAPDTSILDELKTSVAELKQSLRDLNDWRQNYVMPKLQEHEDALKLVKDVTTEMGVYMENVAKRLESLETHASTSGMSGEEETKAIDNVKALVPGLKQMAESLKAMGENPQEPVPVPPPDPLPPVDQPVPPPAEPPAPTEPPATPTASGQKRNALGEPTGSGSAGTPPNTPDGTNQTPMGNPPAVAVDPKNDDGTRVSEPKRQK